MDRSFLTAADVVSASRKFVCIRLATYEDQAEADFMKSIYRGRSGQVENTTFALLSSDGRRSLVTPGRSPDWSYRNSQSMATGMRRIASLYPGSNGNVATDPQLPLVKDFDLALNVAACDQLPVVLIFSDDAAEQTELQSKLLPHAWSDELAGQFVYAIAHSKGELKPIGVTADSSGIYVIAPGDFGMSGTVIAHASIEIDQSDLHATLRSAALKMPRNPKSHDNHVRLGIQLGIKWESKIPETDMEAVRAEQRARGR